MRCEGAAVGGAVAPAEPVHLDVVGDAHDGGDIGVRGGGRGGFLLIVVVMRGKAVDLERYHCRSSSSCGLGNLVG